MRRATAATEATQSAPATAHARRSLRPADGAFSGRPHRGQKAPAEGVPHSAQRTVGAMMAPI